MKPRIAIPTPTTADTDYNRRSWPAYAHAVHACGGEAVEVPLGLQAAPLRELLAKCHGICLPGSPADVDPALYGQSRDSATSPADPARDATDRALLEDALAHGKPVLAICFGLQSLNVWRGGTLLQDISPVPVNHSAGAQVMVAHSAVVERGSLLATLIGDPQEVRLPVNSSHHQAVELPGDGLRIVARSSEDGIIEAVELDPESLPEAKLFHVEQLPFFLGVQWHPERSFDHSVISSNIFRAFLADATRYSEQPPLIVPQ